MGDEHSRSRTSAQLGSASKPGMATYQWQACQAPIPPPITPELVAAVEAWYDAGDTVPIRRLQLSARGYWLTVVLRNHIRGQKCDDCWFPPGWPNCSHRCPRAMSPPKPVQPAIGAPDATDAKPEPFSG
jgi:hypothetical protein